MKDRPVVLDMIPGGCHFGAGYGVCGSVRMCRLVRVPRKYCVGCLLAFPIRKLLLDMCGMQGGVFMIAVGMRSFLMTFGAEVAGRLLLLLPSILCWERPW